MIWRKSFNHRFWWQIRWSQDSRKCLSSQDFEENPLIGGFDTNPPSPTVRYVHVPSKHATLNELQIFFLLPSVYSYLCNPSNLEKKRYLRSFMICAEHLTTLWFFHQNSNSLFPKATPLYGLYEREWMHHSFQRGLYTMPVQLQFQ